MPSLLKKIYQNIPFKRQLFEAIRTIYTPPQSIYRHLFFGGKFKVSVNGHSFLMNHYNTHGFIIEEDVFWLGVGKGREGQSAQLWIQLAKQAEVILDIGANTGLYSLLAQSVNGSSQVYGFEPIKRTFKKFEANCRLNQFNIRCENLALSNEIGKGIMYEVAEENVLSATLSKEFSDVHHAVHKNRLSSSVEITTLSHYVEQNAITRIDLMKVDVEMHEPEVLLGMGKYLKIFQPTMLIEILTDRIGKQVESILEGMEYLYFRITEERKVDSVSELTGGHSQNYIICKKEVAVKLGLIAKL